MNTTEHDKTRFMRFALFLFLLFATYSAGAQSNPVVIACSNVGFVGNQESFDKVFVKKQLYKIDSKMWSLALGNGNQIGSKFRMDWSGFPKFDFLLKESNILAEHYSHEVANDIGKIVYSKPACFTYEGYIIGEPQSSVSLSIREGFVFGFFKINNSQTLFIEPAKYYDPSLPNDIYVVYNTNDVKWSNSAKCGVKELTKLREEFRQKASERSGGQCKQVEIVVASDLSMLNRYGTASAVENHNIGVLNNVNTDYRNNGQFADDIEFKIVKLYQAASPSSEPLLPQYSGTNSNIVLNNFRAWGNSGAFNANFDIATLWTTRNLDEDGAGLNSSLVGLSYVGAVCGNSGYQVLEDYLGNINNGSGYGLRVLASHELGHLFNCSHDAGGNFIMNPVINNTTNWSPSSMAAINAYSQNLQCLSTCSIAGAPTASFRSFSEINCTNVGFPLWDNSGNGPTTWTWTAAGSNISPSPAARNITISFSTAGSHSVTLVAENSSGSSAITQNVSVFNPPAPSCVAGTGATSDAGITYFELGPFSKTSGTSASDGGKYIDNTCATNGFLTTSTSYPIFLSTSASGFSSMGAKVYIDYNNNGILSDPGENVKTIPSTFPPGNYNLGSITTPANPVLNTMLRVRVIASAAGDIGSPCFDPVNGQVEDFGIVFTSALPLELLSFSGKSDRNLIHVNWSTFNEYRNKGFELERSYDGTQFKTLTFIEGKGITNYRSNYGVTDESFDCTSGVVFYRLKMIEEDGNFEYSKIIVIEPSCRQDTVRAYPNPFHETLVVRVNSPENREIQCELFDFQGKLVSQKFAEAKNEEIIFPVENLPAGIYWFRIRQEQEILLYQKMIKF